MALTKIENAIGTINGVNLTFFTTTSFLTGSVRVALNGQLLPAACLTEIDSSTGEILLQSGGVPRTGDTVILIWTDAADVLDELKNIVANISAVVEVEVALEAVLETETRFSGVLREEDILGSLSSEVAFQAILDEEIPLFGRIVCEDS